MGDTAERARVAGGLRIVKAAPEHLGPVAALDARITGQSKPEYWLDIFERYATRHVEQRFFLVAEAAEGAPAQGIVGLIVGEVRGWEFGSEPCGWVFAVSVDPDRREQGVGEALFRALCAELRRIGIAKLRTMVRRDNPLHMSFFRGEGMVAGPYIQLEKSLAED